MNYVKVHKEVKKPHLAKMPFNNLQEEAFG